MSTYTLIKTMGRPIGKPAIVDQIDATNISLLELSQIYYDIYFILKVSIYKTERVLFFNSLDIDTRISTMTIVEYLNSMEGKTIEGLGSEIPVHVKGEVYSWDVRSYDFSWKGVNLNYHPDTTMPDDDKVDLLLSHPGVNYDYACAHSLISINGLFHYFTKSDNGWLIKDGNTTKRKSKDKTQMAVVDFTQVGSISMIPITDEMIFRATENSPLSDNIYINVGVDLSNKTVGYVLGGYFHLLDKTYKQINSRTICIDFNNMRWESLYYMMKKYIDLRSLPLTDFGNDRVLGFELYHDSTIRALLKLSQSFIVVIDNPNVAVIEEVIGDTGIPGRYESPTPPIYPLRIAEGRYSPYKAVKEYNKWNIMVEDNIVPLQVRYQKPKSEWKTIHDRIYPTNGEVYARAAYVRIYSDRNLKTKSLDDLMDTNLKGSLSLKPFITAENIPYRKSTTSEYYLPAKILDVDFTNDYYKVSYPEQPIQFK